MKFKLLVIFLFVFTSICSFSQEIETKEKDITWEETIKWIDSKLDSGHLKSEHTIYIGKSKGIVQQEYDWISPTGVLEITTDNDVYEEGVKKIGILTFWECNLKNLIEVNSDENELILIFSNGGIKGEKTIHVGTKTAKSEDLGSQLKLFLSNNDIIIRLEKAFTNLIKLNNANEKF